MGAGAGVPLERAEGLLGEGKEGGGRGRQGPLCAPGQGRAGPGRGGFPLPGGGWERFRGGRGSPGGAAEPRLRRGTGGGGGGSRGKPGLRVEARIAAGEHRGVFWGVILRC